MIRRRLECEVCHEAVYILSDVGLSEGAFWNQKIERLDGDAEEDGCYICQGKCVHEGCWDVYLDKT